MPIISRLSRRGTYNGGKGTTVPLTPSSNTNHLAETEYAKRCKLILELCNDLRNLEAGLELKLNFPRLVVIGDQSSGKSSLVEAVSGISVPRDSGTCTRCPMECIMRSTAQTTDSWCCRISIKFTRLDDDGRPMLTIIPFGGPIYERSSVDLWIRRAQVAALSPHRSPTEFLTKTESELKGEVDPQRKQFSKDSVLVEIDDPNSPGLDFVDLPGIVHAVDPPELENEVIDLVESFIKSENTLILIAIPMTSDPQTQKALKLAKDADPNLDRTIGILTKPDALQDGDIGSREMWRKILAGEDPSHRTKHGYYCVRLPNDLERKEGNSRARAKTISDDFFKSSAPWNQMDKVRFGVSNFVKNISALLIEVIERYLPKLQEEVERLLDECLRQIAELPPILDKEPSTEIHLRISAFCQAFKDAVFGRERRHFVQKNKRRYVCFSEQILSTKPRYTVFEEGEVVSRAASTVGEDETSEEGEVETAGTGPCLGLAAVREVKERATAWELPPHVPFGATVKLVEMYTSLWERPSIQCFEDILVNSIKFEDALLKEFFGQYHELLSFVHQLTSQERDRCRADALKFLKKILQFESEPLFTQNNELLSERKKWLETNAPHRYVMVDDTMYNRHRWHEQYKDFHSELELMADSYAYFQISHKRIIDYVPLTIEHELNQTFVNNLQTLLFSHITKESTIPGRLEELIQENSTLSKRRVKLEKRKKGLLTIKQKLDTFWSLSKVQSPHSQIPGSVPRPGSSASTDYHSVAGSIQ